MLKLKVRIQKFIIFFYIFFQYYSLLIFIISALVMILVSYFSEAPSYAQLRGLTFGTLSAEDRALNKASYNKMDVAGSVTVMILIILAYLYFTG